VPFGPKARILPELAILPGVKVRLLLTVILALRVNPPLLLVRLLNVVAPFNVCTPAALSATPPPWGVNVPLLFQVPLTIRAKLLELASSVVPEPIVRFA